MSDRPHRSRSKSRRHRHKHRSRTPSFEKKTLQDTLNSILTRLSTIESNNNGSVSSATINPVTSNTATTPNTARPLDQGSTTPTTSIFVNDPTIESLRQASLNSSGFPMANSSASASVVDRTVHLTSPTNLNRDSAVNNNSTDANPNVHNHSSDLPQSTQILVDAIKSLNPARSHNYYVSCFDPSVHDIDAWCQEVDRARLINGWNDHECLSRVAGCLKGDSKTWLHEWVTADRTWTNFVREFKPLCPRKLDYANILFETMNTTSDRYVTYAEYARRTLLRLRVVKGLSDELMTQIVIRGLTDAQVRAAAANANLSPDSLVSFLAIYAKPTRNKPDRHIPNQRKRPFPFPSRNPDLKCFTCGQAGHKSHNCLKKPKSDSTEKKQVDQRSSSCTFCHKPGHTEDKCFAKERSRNGKPKGANLCLKRLDEGSKDLATAIIQGIAIDVLIDSGALDVSLISEDVVKYFSCDKKSRLFTLKGISHQEITANWFVTLTIEFKEISIEADLVVVPSECMSSAPIIIGTDVLNRDGITYVRTKDRQYLTRSIVNPVHTCNVKVNQPLQVNTPLQEKERESLMNVINDFSDFLISGTATTTVTTGKMKINLTNDTPVVYRPYKLAYQEKLKVREIVRDLLDKNIIRESQSEYASPVILVKKKDGSDRMCVDFRALNRITVKDRYPLPLIDDHIDRLGSSKFFSSLDMATGFHQILIDEESIHKTGFVTPEGHYEYLKMPYGLTNSPIVYQRIINNTLRSFIDSGDVLVYVDDVLIMSNTVEEGIILVRRVLETLTNAGFSINLAKCSFLTTEIEYLGRVVSQGQVKPSPTKVAALVNAPAPTNVKQVRQFLGLAGYFRRYIEGYATKTACIAHLTRHGVKFNWGPEQEKVRQELFSRLTTEPVLAIFDPNKPTELHTDASSAGYGAVLLQTHEGDRKRVIAYYSKVTQGAECRYHSYELETLAVVKALQHFRHYLVGLQFKLVTDCNALKSTERKKDLLPRVARWWVYLQDFNFSIEYRKGTNMSHADYLSRNPITAVNNIQRPRNWAQIAQAADNETQDLLQKLQEGQLDSRRYINKNGLLYYKYSPIGEDTRLLCYVPKGHRLSLLRIFHDEHEHICTEKTLDLILKHFWFPGLRQFVSKYVAHCLICVSKKRVPRASHQTITSWEKPNMPFHTVHLDALGPLPESNGFKFVLIIVDSFTKFSLLYPVYRQDSNELKRVFTEAISLFGTPTLLVTDRGRMFESSQFVEWITELGSDIHYITPEMHHSNGQVERYVRTVLNMIRIEVGHRNAFWSEKLWKLQLVLNITKQKTTQASALNLLIGTDSTTPVIRALVRDVALEGSRPNREGLRELCRSRASDRLRRNQVDQDSYVNRHRRAPREFAVNDLVFVIKYSQSTGKLDSGMRGPYKVIKVLRGGRYELKLLGGSYGKTTQAAAQYMVPWRGEWCPETCASFFEHDDTEDSDTDVPLPESSHETDTYRPGPSDAPAVEADASSGEAVLE